MPGKQQILQHGVKIRMPLNTGGPDDMTWMKDNHSAFAYFVKTVQQHIRKADS